MHIMLGTEVRALRIPGYMPRLYLFGFQEMNKGPRYIIWRLFRWSGVGGVGHPGQT